MGMTKGMVLCARVVRKLAVQRIPNYVCPIRQYHRPDEPYNPWVAKRAEDVNKQMNRRYGDDPRFDSRFLKSIRERTEAVQRDTESRRRITQDTDEHQRRQARIIEDNRRRWQNRSDPIPSVVLKEYNKIYGNKRPGDRRRRDNEDQSAEDYSRRRRSARQKEVERQARELRESRKGYNLPKTEDVQDGPFGSDNSGKTYEELKNEEQYWHRWSSCPDERCGRPREDETAELDAQVQDESSRGFQRNDRRGFIKPTLPYDRPVRRFQTHSRQLVDRSFQLPMLPGYPDSMDSELKSKLQWEKQTMPTRRSKGMEKQSGRARNKCFFRCPNMDNIMEVAQPQLAHPKMFGHKFPRSFRLRPNGVLRKIAQRSQRQVKAKRWIEPPRVSTSDGKVRRMRTPVDSFSTKLSIDMHTPHYSEYTGYGPQTVCDAWQNFSNVHNLRPIN